MELNVCLCFWLPDGGVGLILAPSIAIGQIGPGEPDPHEPPPLLVPRRLVWNFSERSPGYVQPTFAAKQGVPFGTTPMFGKIRLVRDMVGTAQAPNKLGWPVAAGEGRSGSNALLIEGDALSFHADSPFLGSVSLWFKETARPPTSSRCYCSVGGIRRHCTVTSTRCTTRFTTVRNRPLSAVGVGWLPTAPPSEWRTPNGHCSQRLLHGKVGCVCYGCSAAELLSSS